MTDIERNRTNYTWRNMLSRCDLRNKDYFKRHAGRGITVCNSWKESFDNFLKDMGPQPYQTVIDRIDNDGNYEPGNCRWVTNRENMRNRSGVKLSMQKAEEIRGLNIRGVSPKDIALLYDVSITTIYRVLKCEGWVPISEREKAILGRGELT